MGWTLLGTLDSMRLVVVTVLALTFSLGAWGRQVLRRLSLDPDAAIGRPLTTIAGAALAALASFLVFPWVEAYQAYLRAWLLLGLLLFVFELIASWLPRLFRAPGKRAYLASWLGRHGSLIATAALAAALSALHSAFWAGGRLEPWLFSNADCYNWAFIADRLLGLARPEAYSLSANFLLNHTLDNFGTHVMAGLTAALAGRSATMSIPVHLLLILVWCGTSIHSIARGAFGLGWGAALVVALGTLAGPFFTYLLFAGQSGQLVAMMAFLAALDRVLAEPFGDRADWAAWGRIAIPVLMILLAYPAGFPVLLLVLGLVRALQAFFRGPAWSAPWRRPGRLSWRIASASLAGLGLAASAGLGACALVPYQAWYTARRFVVVAAQATGWTLPPLGPANFAGLPWYPDGAFAAMAPAGPAGWIMWFVLVALMASLVAGRNRAEDGGSAGAALAGAVPAGTAPAGSASAPDVRGRAPGLNRPAALALAGTLLAAAAVYLAGLLVKGNSYQLWKFASMVVLPLSFVPLCLALLGASMLAARLGSGGWAAASRFRAGRLLVGRLRASRLLASRFRAGRGAAGMAAIVAAHLVAGSFVLTAPRPLTDLPWRIYGVAASGGYLRTVAGIGRGLPPGARLIHSLYNHSLLYLAADLYKDQSRTDFATIGEHYVFEPKYNYDLMMDAFDDYVVVSDDERPGLFLGRRPITSANALNVLDKSWFGANGRAAYAGVNMIRDWALEGDWLSVKVTKPLNLVGIPARLSFTLEAAPGVPEGCAPALSAAFLEDGPRVWSDPMPGLEVEAPLPESLLGVRSFRAALKISAAPEYGRPGRLARCSYRLLAVELTALAADQAPGPGQGGPAAPRPAGSAPAGSPEPEA